MSRRAMSIRKLFAVVACLITCHVASSSLDEECTVCNEAALNASLNPLADKWKNFGLDDFMDEFGCDDRKDFKIPGEETWMIMRKLYQDIVGEKSTIAPLSHESGMNVPFYVAHVPGKGRAVFASKPVKKGTLVWNERQQGNFFDGDSFRTFIVSLPSTELMCDALIWSWAEKRDGILFIASVFDEGSMFNDPKTWHDDEADKESEGDDELPNTGCISETTGEIISGGACAKNYALRDIEAGEEITCEYSEFDSIEALDYFGLSSSLDEECTDCHEAALNVALNPLADKWKNFRLDDFVDEFGCDDRKDFKIPSEETWMIMRRLYQDIVGEKSTIAPLSHESGMNVPFYVAHVPGKGRAVFASKPVKKGTLVWNERQEGNFFDGDSFRKFIVSLPSTELMCDALIWSWAEKRKDGIFFIATAFDEGCMFNDPQTWHGDDVDNEADTASQECISKQNGEILSTGACISDDDAGESEGDDELPNTGCISETTGEIISGGACANNYALRDIEAGEEITCEYSEFDSFEALDYFGLV